MQLYLASNGQAVAHYWGTVHERLPPRTVPIIKKVEGQGIHRKVFYEPVSIDLLIDEDGNHPAPHMRCDPLEAQEEDFEGLHTNSGRKFYVFGFGTDWFWCWLQSGQVVTDVSGPWVSGRDAYINAMRH